MRMAHGFPGSVGKLKASAQALDAIARHLGLFDKTVPAVPPDARRDGRDARTVLVERLKRLARTAEVENTEASQPSPPSSGEREG